MPNGTYGGVRGRKTKVGRKLSFSSYSISILSNVSEQVFDNIGLCLIVFGLGLSVFGLGLSNIGLGPPWWWGT